MIPLKLETLLKGRVVENDRVEYKRGWNPAETIVTICAYANDFNNTNGGYVVIGIDADDNGRPMLPPAGISENKLDKVQQELLQYCNFITPRYIPQIEIVKFQDENVLYLWCSAGDAGPYSAPKDVLSKNKHKEYWIKPASSKMIAKGEELSELFSKFNSVPYDDRVNRLATVNDITYGYIEEFLRKSGSSLVNTLKNSTIEDLLLSLEVANETDVGLEIRNIGVLMFSDRPHKFIPGAQIDLVRFHSPDAERSDDFTEMTFTGPIFKQINDALSYIKSSVIEEKVIKVRGQAEAVRFFSYPYEALEEILVNAIFHKSYREPEPVEIRMYVDCIMVLNYPGPARWIDMEKFAAGKIKGRKYRNRRIGDFLKELDLTEKQSTGINKILEALSNNGSPPPLFETDIERMCMEATIKIHEGFKADEPINEPLNEPINEPLNTFDSNDKTRQEKIVSIIRENPYITLEQLTTKMGISRATVKRDIEVMKQNGIIKRIGSRKTGYWQISE